MAADGVTWPMVNGSSVQKNYEDPKGTVYITEGNGGVPGVTSAHKFVSVQRTPSDLRSIELPG